MLRIPLGHDDFVSRHLERTRQKHRKLSRRIPTLPDVQSAWRALQREHYLLKVVRLEWFLEFARGHDQELWVLCSILAVLTGAESVARASTTLPLGKGRIGFEEC